MTGRPRLLDLYGGECGSGVGWHRAGFDVVGVDNSAARLSRYPFECYQADAIEYVLEHGREFDFIHASPPCTGYSRGTAALPDRLTRYDRLIAATREALLMVGRGFVIENVADARSELVDPIMLCGRMFNLRGVDEDGCPLITDRHRLFEFGNMDKPVPPPHPIHTRTTGVGLDVPAGITSKKQLDAYVLSGQGRFLTGKPHVAGAYGGARRDKWEAKYIRKGGYVPSADVQRAMLGVPWMSDEGVRLSIPPVYTEWIGRHLLGSAGGVDLGVEPLLFEESA